MIKYLITTITILSLLGGVQAAAETGLARYMPRNPLVYIEADDLAGLLETVRTPSLEKAFMKSEVFNDFSNSKLYLKLTDRIQSLEENTGFGLTLDRAAGVAGTESALALYDIGELRMTFITRVGAEKVNQSALWPLRDSFDTRRLEGLEGQSYYVKEDPYGRASLAFIFVDDLLIISTDVTRFEESLMLLKNQGDALDSQSDFAEATGIWPEKSNIRLYLQQSEINKTPYFRSYWIYDNESRFSDVTVATAAVEIGAERLTEYRTLNFSQPRQRHETQWNEQMQQFQPVLFSCGGLDDQALARWVETVFPAMDKKTTTELTELLQRSVPTGKATVVELANGEPAVTYLLQFSDGEPEQQQLESLLSRFYTNKLLPGFAEPLNFADDGGYRRLQIPLHETRAPAFKLSAGSLFIQPRRYQTDDYNSRVGTVPGDVNSYSAVDLEQYRASVTTAVNEIAGLNAWSYSSGKELIGENFPSLLQLLTDSAAITWMEKTVTGTGNRVTEQVVYHLR